MTQPGADQHGHTAPTILIPPATTDQKTGALFVHESLLQRIAPYELEDHISPVNTTQKLGDVESWAHYVLRYTNPNVPALLTWNARGLQAVLDYHTATTPGRATWRAEHDFFYSRQWKAWKNLANGEPLSHEAALDALEDNADDIVEPKAAELMELLRGLKLTSNKSLDVIRRPDGTSYLQVMEDNRVAAGQGTTDLPNSITVGIPVFDGQRDAEGNRVLEAVTVRLRVAQADKKAMFRLTMPGADAIRDKAIEDQIAIVTGLLGKDTMFLRAAG